MTPIGHVLMAMGSAIGKVINAIGNAIWSVFKAIGEAIAAVGRSISGMFVLLKCFIFIFIYLCTVQYTGTVVVALNIEIVVAF